MPTRPTEQATRIVGSVSIAHRSWHAANARRALSLLIVSIACAFAFLGPQLLFNRILPSDGQYAAYFQPWALWATDWAAGWPLVADTPSMASYPIRLLLAGMGLPFNLFVLTAFVLAFSGTFAYVRALGCGRAAAAVGAVSFTFSGWMYSHLGHTSMIHAAAWLPWCLVAIERGIRSRSHRREWTLLLSFCALLCILAGHLQLTLYVLAVAGLYLVFRAMTASDRLRVIASFGLALAVGVLASSFVLLPTLELAALTSRESLTPERLFQYSLTPLQALDLIVPFLHGATSASGLGIAFFGSWNIGEVTGYALPITVFLVGWGLAGARRDNGRAGQVVFWCCIASLALMLAFGDHFVPGAWFTYLAPVFNKFRAQARHLFEFTFSISILAALGMQALLERQVSGRRRVLLVMVLLSGLPLGMAYVCYPNLMEEAEKAGAALPEFAVHPAVVWSFVSVLAALLSIWIASSCRKRGVGISIVLVVLSAGLILYGRQLPWSVYTLSKEQVAAPAWAVRYRSAIGLNYRVLGLNGYEDEFFGPEPARLHHVRTLGWYGPLILRSISELSGVTNAGWTRREALTNENRALDLLAVRYVAATQAEKPLFTDHPERWKVVEETDSTVVFENLRVQPRSWIVSESVFLPGQQALVAIVTSGANGGRRFDPQRTVLVDHARNAHVGNPASATSRIVSDTGSTLTIDVESSATAYLVVADAWYPGWTAHVGGVETEVMRANYAMRAVAIPEGRSRVIFSYRPTIFVWGLCASAAAALLALLGFFFLSRPVQQ